MTPRKKKTVPRKPSRSKTPLRKPTRSKAKPKKKWWRLGIGNALVSEDLVARAPVDLLRAEVSRHLKKKHPENGFLVTETRYANVPFFIATYFDEYHTDAYLLMKERGLPGAERMLPETTVDLGTFHDGLLRAL